MDELKKLLAEATPLPWTHASDKLAAGNIKASDNARLIVAAVNALPELLAERDRLREALVFYADESNYIETTLPLDLSQETRKQAPRIGADCGRRAQNALAGKTARLTPTEASDARRVREVVPELIGQLRTDAAKMKPGPERIHVLAASNWLDSLLSRLPTPPAAQTLKERNDG